MSRLQRLGRSFDFPKLCPLRSPPTAFSGTLKTPVPTRQMRHSFLQCQRRPVQAQCYNSAPPPSPPPLGLRTTSRLLYRADGTPRSKLTGLAIASIATLSFLLYEALAVIDKLDHGVHLLAALLHVQRADYRLFASTDLADPAHLLRLYHALQAPVNLALEDVYSEVERLSLGGDEQIHSVLREACEGVHDILHDPLEEVHDLAAASKIIGLLDQSFVDLLHILNQRPETSAPIQKGLGDASQRQRGEDYEVVG